MKVGTKSVLFGVHAFWLHPWIVLIAWFIVHRCRPSLVELMAILTHDLGYLGMPNMDGKEGSSHPEKAANWWRGKFGLFGDKVAIEILGHSRFYASANNIELSALFQPDKLATALYPIWLYLLLANLSGEIKEYMDLCGTEKYPDYQKDAKTQTQWLIEIQGHMALMGIQGEKYYIVMKQMDNDKKKYFKSKGEMMNKEKCKYSSFDTRGKLFVDCTECIRGRNGVKDLTKYCSAGMKVKKTLTRGCFVGELLNHLNP